MTMAYTGPTLTSKEAIRVGPVWGRIWSQLDPDPIMDFCSIVPNGLSGTITCIVGFGTADEKLVSSAPIPLGVFARAWVDTDGDRRPDFCRVIENGILRVRGLQRNVVIECRVEDLLQAWQGTEVV